MPDDVPDRVAFVTGANMSRGAPGGIRSYVLGLARFLDRAGIGVDLLANGPIDDAPRNCRARAVTRGYVGSSVGYQRALRRWASSNDFGGAGILHLQRADDLIPLLHSPELPPAVLTLHGDSFRGIRRRHGAGLGFAYRLLESRAIHRYQVILAVDQGTAVTYRRRYPRLGNRLRVVPIAVDVAEPPSGSRRRTVPSTRSFLYVGRLSVEKRVDAIIRAMADPDLATSRLLIAGSGPEEPELRTLADGSNVTFLGNVSHETLADLYRDASALVLASEFEGLPTVALEALAHGCPVVAVEGCGVDRIIDAESGVLVPDVAHLADGMAETSRLREVHEPVSLPVTFTWASVGPQVVQAYRDAVRRGFA